MQKKIVAAICAAALALALPMAAFAADNAVNSNGTCELSGTVKGSNDSVALSSIKFTKVNGSVKEIKVDKAGSTNAAPSNALPGSASSWTIEAHNNKWNPALVNGLGQDANMTAKVAFDDSVIRDLPSSIAADNLYVGGNYVSNVEGGTVIPMTAQPVAGVRVVQDAAITSDAATGNVNMTGVGTGTLTLWMQNGKYASGDTANAAKVADEAKDGSKSPKTGELL